MRKISVSHDFSTAWRRVLCGLAGALTLALVFAAYLNPHTVLDLANRVWGCF